MEQVAATDLPQGYGYEWTGTAFQEKQAGGAQAVIFILGLLFVFLFLAAQYESWTIPFAIILAVPLGVFGAFLGTWLRGLTNDVYVQVGLLMLIGLSAKNAILIIEYAKELYEEGRSVFDAAFEASRLRFRPIMMTAISSNLGNIPLVVATGAGALARNSLGTAVFAGYLLATSRRLTPVLTIYLTLSERMRTAPSPSGPTPVPGHQEGGAHETAGSFRRPALAVAPRPRNTSVLQGGPRMLPNSRAMQNSTPAHLAWGKFSTTGSFRTHPHRPGQNYDVLLAAQGGPARPW
jgi:HAE1 family hydrophobic/amphiphilic exporter-1/multidrug efflux pump